MIDSTKIVAIWSQFDDEKDVTFEVISINNENGFLVKNGDLDDFCKTVKYALSYSFDKRNMIASVNKKYSADKILKEYHNSLISVYQKSKIT